MSNDINFDIEVAKMEEAIINFLPTLPMFSTKDPNFVKIIGYFIMRLNLTQDSIKQITGLSSGKVSQELNDLLDSGLIERKRDPNTRKYVYYAKSAGHLFLRFTKYIMQQTLKWEDIITRNKEELEESVDTLKSLEGYDILSQTFSYFKLIMDKYQKVVNFLDESIEKLD